MENSVPLPSRQARHLDWETSLRFCDRTGEEGLLWDRGWGGAGHNQYNLAIVSSSRPEVKVQARWPPSRLHPELGVRDPTHLRADRLSLGPAGPWKLYGGGPGSNQQCDCTRHLAPCKLSGSASVI